MIYTGRINYNGNIQKIDITAKSSRGIGSHFKPTWDMVMKYKSGKLSQEAYKKLYSDILEENYIYTKELIKIIKYVDIVFVCYCRSGDFCHRVLLAKYISGLSKVYYAGEIT